jgi:hypothetical protein
MAIAVCVRIVHPFRAVVAGAAKPYPATAWQRHIRIHDLPES